MPATFLTVPRELGDEIYIYPALSCSFAFLLTCRQINEEGTSLLYKHGIYRPRPLDRLPVPPKPPPFWLVQNLYIAMPSGASPEAYRMARRTAPLLAPFAGTEVHRRTCTVNMGAWQVSEDMARVLCDFGGFEIVRLETVRGGDWAVKLIKEGLECGLRKAEWKVEQKRPATETTPAKRMLVAEFRPRDFKAMNGSERIGIVQSEEQGAEASSTTSSSPDVVSEDEELVLGKSMAHHKFTE